MADSTTSGTHFDENGSIIARVGEGAYGITYLVKNDEEERYQILKVPINRDEYSINLFLREGQEMKNFPAKSFVQVDEIGGVDHDLSAGEPPYILMDYIPGITLFDYLEALRNYPNKPYTMDPVIKFKIIYGIAYSLACLHLNGRVHRDIKPSNIFLDHNFQPHLGDFGEITDKTTTQNIHGTVNYLPPEAYQPDGAEIPCGPQYDIYEFGATLFHILTYEWPYSDLGSGMNILRDYIAQGKLDQRFEPGNIDGNVILPQDQQLYQLAKMCMAFDRNQRPNSNLLIQWIAEGAQQLLTPDQFSQFAAYGAYLSNGQQEHYGTFENCRIAIQNGFAERSDTLSTINAYEGLNSSPEQLNQTYQRTTVESNRLPVKSVRAPMPQKW